jgi:hypothetical protein
MSLHEFDSVRLLLCERGFRQLKIPYGQNIVFSTRREHPVFCGGSPSGTLDFAGVYSARLMWPPSAPTKRQRLATFEFQHQADLRPHHWTGDYRAAHRGHCRGGRLRQVGENRDRDRAWVDAAGATVNNRDKRPIPRIITLHCAMWRLPIRKKREITWH